MKLIYDRRWEGPNGIGRVAGELHKRVFLSRPHVVPRFPSSQLSPLDPFVRGAYLSLFSRDIYFSPGFNPPVCGLDRSIFMLYDLIHLRVPGEAGLLKRQYYERLVRPAVSKAFRVLTLSEYSRRDIVEWSGAPESAVTNVGGGVDDRFFVPVERWSPGYPYFLYVGARKLHKNLDRLLMAYAQSKASAEIRLVLSGKPDAELSARAAALGLSEQLVFAGHISEDDLPSYYQGAVALLFPSYFEGFGLPPLEAMAGGTPAMTSSTTSLPEAVGDAALMVDPFSVDALKKGIDRIAGDTALRSMLSVAGPVQARRHSWDQVTANVSIVLEQLERSAGG